MKKLLTTALLSITILVADVIIPNINDIHKCQNVSKSTAEYFPKADQKFIVDWFSSAARVSDMTLTQELLDPNNTIKMESELNKLTVRVESDRCKEFVKSLKESHREMIALLKENTSRPQGADKSRNTLYIVATQGKVDVVEEPVLGKKVIKGTVKYGTGLILKSRVKLNSFEEWGEFVYDHNSKIGWINMMHVLKGG